MPAALPSGTVTFLFTDIEGSTQLLQRLGERYAEVLLEHQRLLRQAFSEDGGVEVDTQGDSFFVAFPTAPAAVTAAAAATRALAEHSWPDGTTLRVRMGLHTGSPQLVGDRYVGIDVHRAARIAAAGHGGQILLSPTTRELVASTLSDGATLRDLGTYQLKDFPQPEHLYQLVLPGLPETFPRLKTLDRPPHDLPPRAPAFVGREADIATLTTALRSGQAMAVVGMGGLGKSSLAAEVVHTVARDPAVFPGGIAWVRGDERGGVEGLSWILDQLLVAWEAPLPAEAIARVASLEEGVVLRERALQKRLRPAPAATDPSPSLVFLDNVESRLPLDRLLATVQPLGVVPLLTMRSEPASAFVQLLRLEALPEDAARQLFAERYRSRGGVWLAERDTKATVSIVQTLGYLPLAIELAAARAARTQLLLTALAKELQTSDVLSQLSDPLDTSASVRYSLGKTLAILSPSQRLRFVMLGLPEGADWPYAVIETLCAGMPAPSPDDLRNEEQAESVTARADLEALVAYSFVGQVGDDNGGDQRMRLHPLVRELAREEWKGLSAAEQEAALQALLAGVHTWVVRHMDTSATGFASLARDENLITGAIRTAVARQVGLSQVIATIQPWEYLHLRNPALGREMGKLQLECARALGDRRAEMIALLWLGRGSQLSGQRGEHIANLQAALALAREIGDQSYMLMLLGYLGADAAEHGHPEEAERMYRETSTIAQELGDQLTDWNALNGLGALASALRHLPEAKIWFDRAIASAQAESNLFHEGTTLINLGFLYANLGDTATAQQIHEEILRIIRPYGMAVGTAIQLNALGQLALRTGDLATATGYLDEALDILEQASAVDEAAQVRGNLALVRGLVAMRHGDQAGAEEALEEAARYFEADSIPAVDQRPYVHELLAELQKQPASSMPLTSAADPVLAAGAKTVTTSRARRRWWPWGQRDQQE